MFQHLPECVSTFGPDIDSVLYLIYYVVGAWFLLAEAVVFYCLLRFRQGRRPTASYLPGTTGKSLAWILVPSVLILVCDLFIDAESGRVWRDVKETIPQADVTIRITARQFAWQFTHPGPDNVLDTRDDIITNGHLHVPVNKVVRFDLGSLDVIHSFYSPSLRLKQDAVPGRTIRGWFQVTRTGEFPIACAELCGVAHTVMQATLIVQTESDYRQWSLNQQ